MQVSSVAPQFGKGFSIKPLLIAGLLSFAPLIGLSQTKDTTDRYASNLTTPLKQFEPTLFKAFNTAVILTKDAPVDSVARELLLRFAPAFGLSIEELTKKKLSGKAKSTLEEIIKNLGSKPLKAGATIYFSLLSQGKLGFTHN